MELWGRRSGCVLGLLLPVWIGSSLLGRDIEGKVTDERGAAIPGATVEIAVIGSSAPARIATTDGNGNYKITNVPSIPEVLIRVDAPGFEAVELISTQAGSETLNFILSPPGSEVVVSTPGVTQIAELPLSGNNTFAFITLDPGSDRIVETTATRCQNKLLVGSVQRVNNRNQARAYWVEGEVVTSIDLGITDGVFNLQAGCLNDQPFFAANLPDPGGSRRLATARPANWTWQTFDVGAYQDFHVTRDGRFACSYIPTGRGNFCFFDLSNGSKKGCFEPAAGTGAGWGAGQGASKPVCEAQGDNLALFHEAVFTTFSRLTLSQFNTQLQLLRQTTVGQDTFPTAPTVHSGAGMLWDTNGIHVIRTNRGGGCNEILSLDPGTGNLQGKPILLETDVPTNFGHSKSLVPKLGGLLALDFAAEQNRFEPQLHFLEFQTEFGRSTAGVVNVITKSGSVSWGRLVQGEWPVGSLVGDGSDYSLIFPGGSLDLLRLSIASAPLTFAQFADGGGLFSQIILTNPNLFQPVTAKLHLRNQQGNDQGFNLSGQRLTIPGTAHQGTVDLPIPAGGQVTLSTDGGGQVVVGSASVSSADPVSGVVVFGGPLGLAGVLSSQPLRGGFSAAVEVDSAQGINTGVAIVNLEARESTRRFFLFDATGKYRATAELTLPAKGQRARFVGEFNWDTPVDFKNFRGQLILSGEGLAAATVIQTRPGQFAAFPVSPRR